MNRANRYLLKHFSELFSSLFFILFFITSVVFFIKIAALTAVIKMNFSELGTLYIYLLPRTLMYTLPITFFIALCITLFNLSRENETIVLFTLGYNPAKIARFFMGFAFLLSVILVIDLFVLIPISKQLNSNFIEYKKAEAKFNIKASEFGQKFEDWFVYIENSDTEKKYEGITLYQTAQKNDKEKLILAKNALIDNDKGVLRLRLSEGKIFDLAPLSLEQTNFESMHINAKPKNSVGQIQTVMQYWNGVFTDNRRAYDLSFFLLIALFPLATTLIALSIGIVTYRYNRGGIYLSMFSTIALYITLTTLLSSWHPQSAPMLVILLFGLLSYRIYLKRIKEVF